MLPDKVPQIESYIITAEATPGYHDMLEIASSKYAFQRTIREVTVPDGVEVINMEAFMYCINLRKITLPASLRYINYRAFYCCNRLEKVIFQGTAEQWANLKIEQGNPSIIIESEPECSDEIYDYTVLDDGTIRLDSYKLTALAAVEIPSEFKGYIVSEIGPNCFSNKEITHVSIPDTVKYIDPYAFSRCTKLLSVTIPDSVIVIQEGAFYLCASLETVILNHLSSQLTMIETQAFYGCVKLKAFTIPNSVKIIQPYAFQYCKALYRINIPANLAVLGVGAYLGCDGIELIEVDAGNMVYGVLNGCLVTHDKTVLVYCPGSKTGEYKVPDSIINIFPHAFHDCKKLTTVILPYTTKTIGSSAFYGCSLLENINITDLTSIDDDAFSECISLKSVNIRTSYAGRNLFADCTNIESVVVEEGVRSINAGAFRGCASLKVVNLPSTLTYIGFDVFLGIESEINIIFNGTEYQWDLLKVNIPDNIKYTITYNS